jgi:hypothetical protein
VNLLHLVIAKVKRFQRTHHHVGQSMLTPPGLLLVGQYLGHLATCILGQFPALFHQFLKLLAQLLELLIIAIATRFAHGLAKLLEFIAVFFMPGAHLLALVLVDLADAGDLLIGQFQHFNHFLDDITAFGAPVAHARALRPALALAVFALLEAGPSALAVFPVGPALGVGGGGDHHQAQGADQSKVGGSHGG